MRYSSREYAGRNNPSARDPPELPVPARLDCVASGSCPAPENHQVSWVLSHYFVENIRSWGVLRASEQLCQKVYVESKSQINGVNPYYTRFIRTELNTNVRKWTDTEDSWRRYWAA